MPIPLGDIATGPEKRQNEGKGYHEENISLQPFGTMEKPVVINSVFSSRIIGCTGGVGHDEHELLWHVITEGKPTVCIQCGQFFQHTYNIEAMKEMGLHLPGESHDDHHGHGNDHGHSHNDHKDHGHAKH